MYRSVWSHSNESRTAAGMRVEKNLSERIHPVWPENSIRPNPKANQGLHLRPKKPATSAAWLQPT